MKQQYIFIAFSLATGGAEKRLACITNYLAAQGHDVKIILLEDAPQVHKTDPRIEIITLSRQTPILRSRVRLFLRKFLLKSSGVFFKKLHAQIDERIRLDNVYVTRLLPILRAYPDATIVSFMTFPSLATSMALKGLKNKWCFVECTSPHFEFSSTSPVPILRKKYYKKANGAVFQTEEASSYYNFIPNLNKVVIPNPLPPMGVERYEGERKKTIVTFCRMSRVKNIPLLLDAFAMFEKDFPEYTLELYGDGEAKEQWMQYASTLPCADKICFHNAEQNIAAKLYDAGMFVSSSDREGLSNSMLEALAVGLPCICTDCPAGGARMFIKSFENGILIPVGDRDRLCEAMSYFASHPESADICSRNAVSVRELLDETKILTQWEHFLEELQ